MGRNDSGSKQDGHHDEAQTGDSESGADQHDVHTARRAEGADPWSPDWVLDDPCTPRQSSCDTARVSDDENPWLERKTGHFTLLMLVGADGVDPIDDNVDVEVVLAGEAERWGVTVYTLVNLGSLMRKWEQSGECGGGRYFWADRALIVRRLDADSVVEVIEALLDADEFSTVMERLGEDA